MPFFVLDFTRCWVVRWPKKDDSRCFKDANEVLKCLGPAALKEVIQTAEKYEACQLHPWKWLGYRTQIVSNLKVGVLQSLPAEENHLQTRRRNPFAQFLLLYLENAVFFAPAQTLCLVLNTRKKKALNADTRSPVMRSQMWKFICNLKIFTLTGSGLAAGNVVDFHFGEHVRLGLAYIFS
ncbi:hypothetical protein NC651_004508 [Populus alba x Populus x berolinensis]|nr:hypothetical protein NC651_004508 [Populus alba x Populus x berolinensis]